MRQPPVSFDTFFKSIWYKIPEVFRNADPEVGRPLQILTLTMAQQMYYYFYLKIYAMDELFDPDKCPQEYLAFLSSLVGWKLVGSDPDSWRQQIKHAPLLYKIKGTEKSIVIAEKLIGYSVFMTELYRDYTGNIVPKEKLFNTFPVSIKVKPWFRKTSIDTEKHLFNDAFSDLFPAFNEGTSEITSLGELLHPKKLRRASTRFVPMSTTVGYDPKTGAASLARLAKLPRINLVLKKDRDLDYVASNGVSTDATATDALALLLQFKPFHVYINNLVVLYSLTDYLFGNASTPSGDGSLPGDAVLFRETLSVYGTVEVSGSTERVSYKSTSSSSIPDISTSEQNTSINKGNVLVKYSLLDFTNILTSDYVTDASYLESIGMSLKGYNRAYIVDQPNHIWNFHTDFIPITLDTPVGHRAPEMSSILPYSTPPVLSGNVITPMSSGYGLTSFTDTFTYSYLPTDFTSINYSFVSKFANAPNITHLHNFIPVSLGASSIVSLVPSADSGFLQDTVTINYTVSNSSTVLQSVQNYISGDAWSLDGLFKFRRVLPTVTKLSTGIVLNTDELVLQELYNQGTLLVASYEGHHIILQESDYKIDSRRGAIVFNMYSIVTKLEQYFYPSTSNPDYFYFPLLKIHALYAEKESTTESFNVDTATINRGTGISSKRKHKKFNRFEFADTTAIDTLRSTQSVEHLYEVDSATGMIDEAYQYARGFNSQLPTLFTRKTLFEEERSSVPVLQINSMEPRNESLWTIFKPSPASFVGSTPLMTDFFANYYNIDTYTTVADTVAYSAIDMSSETQIANRSSDKWKTFVSNVPTHQKEYFLITRNNDPSRISRWTRGSALKSSRPYIGASRASVQPFRSDLTSFNRSSMLKDYATSSISRYPHLGNYSYVTSSNTDVTSEYFSVEGIPVSTTPTTNEFIYVADTTKATVSETGVINYPTSTLNISSYDTPFDSLHASKYYASETSTTPSFSMYAGNIRFDVSPTSGVLLNTLFDNVDIDISGLVKQNLSLSWTDIHVSRSIALDYNTYIVWRELNTGDTVNIGLAPDVSYSLVRSNIRFLHNGIELSAGNNWFITDNPMTLNVDPSLAIEEGDVFSLEYETLGAAVHDDPRLVVQTGLTAVSSESTTVSSINRNYLRVVPFTHSPVIEWSDGATYCGWSETTTNSTNTLPPEPLIHVDTAVPNVTVSVVSTPGPITVVLVYGTDWKFRAIPDTVSYRIQLLQHASDSLKYGDQIHIAYKYR